MKFAQLLASVEWSDLKEELILNYSVGEDSVQHYRSAFSTLKKLEAAESKMRIIIHETFREGLDEQPFTEVLGRDGTLNKELNDFKHFRESVDPEYVNSEADYGLTLTRWQAWLGMEIDPATTK